MKFTRTDLLDGFLVDMEPIEDERGLFARTFCRREFFGQGIDFIPLQASISCNIHQGTLRGMHYQAPPHSEGKLVRVVKGSIFDVALDLRPESNTYLGWVGHELSAKNRRAHYVPPGCAHGYLTLTDDTEILYLITTEFRPEASRVVRWDDPAFAIEWPLRSPRIISDKDRSAKDFQP